MPRKLSMTVLVCSASLWVNAQMKSVAPAQKVYTYVEQMPQLPGGGGQQRIVNEILKRMRYPAIDTSKQMRYSGIKYTFVVDTTGKVRNVAMVTSSDNLAVDQAILDAVHSLPKFSPGKQDGHLVPVRFTFTIGCILVR